MNVGTLLFVIRDIVNYLEQNAMLKVNGTIILTDTAKDIDLASVVETSLKEHGVGLPDQVDKVVKSLPLFISIFVQ